MLQQKYYEKNGQLKPTYKNIMYSNKSNYPREHLHAVKWAAGFIEHPSIEPWDEYVKKFKELTSPNLQAA